MSNWQSKKVELGSIRKNTSKTAQFIALPNAPEIIDITAQCGCTKPSYDPVTRILTVTYKAGEIPKHIQGNTLSVSKKLTVIYKGNETEELEITATKTRY